MLHGRRVSMIGTVRRPLILLLALASAPAGAAPADEAVGARAAIPADVARYIDRRRGCNHWLGEDGYDAERAREIARVVKKLACTRIDGDEARLRRRHARSPQILKAMDDARWLDG